MDRKELYTLFKNSSLSETIPSKKDSSSTTTIRIIHYNVNLWKSFEGKCNFDSIIEWLSTCHADIICLNECLFSSTSEVTKPLFVYKIKNKLGFPYITMANDYYGINVVCSKFPFASSYTLPLLKDPIKKQTRYALHIQFQEWKNFHLLVTHLDAFDNTEQTRLLQIKQILNYMKEKNIQESSLLLGDLNSLLQSDYTEEEWKEIKKQDLKIGLKETPTLVSTELKDARFIDIVNSSNFEKGEKEKSIFISCWSNRRIDMCYIHSSSLLQKQIKNCKFTKQFYSDHFPLLIDLDLK